MIFDSGDIFIKRGAVCLQDKGLKGPIIFHNNFVINFKINHITFKIFSWFHLINVELNQDCTEWHICLPTLFQNRLSDKYGLIGYKVKYQHSQLTTTGSPLVHKTLTEFDFMSPCTYNKQNSKKALPCYTEKETFFILRLKDVWRERR